ncbi:DUF4249 domain-containing protein [Muricauda sp. CAU 1633]|uniref:DUF4249 domain-containing protein n=1 Tax=Allomuricauda sp. CAU 1633 TaxID=2816036 RepID=UPI001A8E1B5D|nr:DUF4249 domain-containing protein [Muricauda sp. CAU 1633]MBO0323075.1 DUF4249 domain-containing protein [Muricauda sp. CAU 1633]
MKVLKCLVQAVPLVFMPMQGCIEPFDTSYVDFESALVIDATITDEPKHQEIFISRTYEFEADGPSGESGAMIKVVSENGNTYDFTESEAGTYISNQVFSAEPNLDYALEVTTKDGRQYASNTVQMAGISNIDTLFAVRMFNDFGEEGMGIFMDGSSSGDGPGYYRYEYEETYRIVAPHFRTEDLVVVEQEPPLQDYLELGPRSGDEFVCYPTDHSIRLILNDTEELDGNGYTNFNVRFISRESYILAHRYSILVRQYVQSKEADSFYSILQNFSSLESLFSQIQPGYLSGNIFSQEDRNEKVLGYFGVVSIDEKRIFFNYVDYFLGEPLPPYVNPCRYTAPCGVIDLVRYNEVKYIKPNEGEIRGGCVGPHITVPRVCGDCTALGPSEVPEFWTD